MGQEATATYIDSLQLTNPDDADNANTLGAHHRLMRGAIRRTLPMLAGPVSASHQAITYTNDLSGFVQAQLNALRDGSATANAALVALFANSASYAALAGAANTANSASAAGYIGAKPADRVLAYFSSSYSSGLVWLRSDSASLSLMADGDLWFRFT